MEAFFLFIVLLIILFLLGVPVAVSIGLTCLAVLWQQNGISGIPLSLLSLKMLDGVNSFPLLAIPFFILAANIMLPVGGVLIAVFTAWMMSKDSTFEELNIPPIVYKLWLFVVRYVAPVGVILIFLQAIGVFHNR